MDFSLPRSSADLASQVGSRAASPDRAVGVEEDADAFAQAHRVEEQPSGPRYAYPTIAQDMPMVPHDKAQADPEDAERQAAADRAQHVDDVSSQFARLDPRRPEQREGVHQAASMEYRSDLATPQSLHRAYEADRDAERVTYRSRSIFSDRRSPTELAVERAVQGTWGTRNAQMMADVIRGDTPTRESYMRNHFGYGGRLLDEQTNRLGRSDPRHDDARAHENWNSGLGLGAEPVPTYEAGNRPDTTPPPSYPGSPTEASGAPPRYSESEE